MALTDWQARALRMRREGHTNKFIAQQIARDVKIQIVDVIAFLTRVEREREMKKGEQG